jgi:hypothetical protein
MSFRAPTMLLLITVACAVAGCGGQGRASARPTAVATTATRNLERQNQAASFEPSVLPGPVLIADRGNNRVIVVNPQGRIIWEFPRRGDLRPGQSFRSPDDAFFSPDGRQIIVTQEDDFVLSVIDIASHRIVYRYGVPGVPGSGPNHLWNPDDAMLFRGGWILVADIKNCRLLLIKTGDHRPRRVYGATTQNCYHAPPRHWGSPNGAFPMRNGHVLVTEINGDWVDEMTLAGNVIRSWHPPGFTYPSDTNEIKPGLYLSVDYTSPGGLETFDRQGHTRWRYEPNLGDQPLNHPSLATPLPNGDILLNDDGNDRAIVVDPNTNRILWQYGHTGVPGRAPGYLNDPDGLDLAPPYSLLVQHPITLRNP